MNLRKAYQSDQKTIRRMIWDAGINPLQLDWRHFVMATDAGGRVVGCIQVKTHGDGTRELASLVVLPDCRGQGIARQMIDYMLGVNAPPLYLTCESRLESLYRRFGFQALTLAEMPPYFHRLARIMRFFMPPGRGRRSLSVMRWDGPAA